MKTTCLETPSTATKGSLGVRLGCVLRVAGTLALSPLLAETGRGAELRLPSFSLNEVVYTNAVVVSENPVDVLLRLDDRTYKRLRRAELPEKLRVLFPFDPDMADEYQKEKAEVARARQEEQRQRVRAGLLRQEAECQTRISQVTQRLVELQKQINITRARPRGRGKMVLLDSLLEQKAVLTRQLDTLNNRLQTVRAQIDGSP